METINFVSMIPLELWTKIFSYLPRRERFVCMCLSPRWREAMDVPSLWKHMSVRLDVDFFEVSTIQVMIEYGKYVKSLELRFEYSDEPIQWVNYRMMDITKRTYRFLSIFVNRNVQIQRLAFKNFCVFYKTKKILYYLSMFFRAQTKIKTISFNGSFFTKKTFVKLLTSSLHTSNKSVEYLDIQNSYYENEVHSLPGQYNVLTSQLIMCVTNIDALRVLRIDFESMVNNNIIGGILNSNCNLLEWLDIRIAEHDLVNVTYAKLHPNSVWISLKKKLPPLKVSVIFCNIFYEISYIDTILTRSIPMYSISWLSDGFLFTELVRSTFKKFSKTLEIVKLEAKEYLLNEYAMYAIQDCPNLRYIEMSGTINSVPQLQEFLLRSNFEGFGNYDHYVKSSNQSGEVTICNERMYKNYTNKSSYCIYSLDYQLN